LSPHATFLVRALAGFDLVVTGALALPVTGHGFIELLYRVNGFLGGVSAPPYFDPIHWLFVSLAGVLGVLWALGRILEPTPLLAHLDSAGRVAVALWILRYVVASSAPGVLLAFVGTELVGAILQERALRETAGRAA
jgi:hypothetical protein